MSVNPAGLMTITEFCRLYPEYAFSPGRTQAKCWDPPPTLPIELVPLVSGPVRSRRGLPSPNQTLTHHQCLICGRVLRNDQFNQPEQYTRQNVGNPYCRECHKKKNAAKYRESADVQAALRLLVWQYIAPACVVCGFDKHTAAIDMHHIGIGKDKNVGVLVASFAQAPTVKNATRLAAEAAKCVPLCANCHRLVHVGAIEYCPQWQPKKVLPCELLWIAGRGGEATADSIQAALFEATQ